MDNERRLAKLEQELETLKENFKEYAKIHQHILGESQAYQTAIMALIETHSDPDLLADQLRLHFAQLESHEVFQANNEERLQGLQDGQVSLFEACSVARRIRCNPG